MKVIGGTYGFASMLILKLNVSGSVTVISTQIQLTLSRSIFKKLNQLY